MKIRSEHLKKLLLFSMSAMIRKIISRFSTLFSSSSGHRSQTPSAYKRRNGQSIPVDEAFIAWTTGSLDQMIDAAESDTHPVDRHFLLQRIVQESYKLRKSKKYRDICLEFAERHFTEFDELSLSLKKEMDDMLPRVTVFQQYATVLTEIDDFDRAIKVCEKAIEHQLHDGTKSGFPGRIHRIKKKIKSGPIG